MKPPRGLNEAERRAWAKLAATVEPIAGRVRPVPPPDDPAAGKPPPETAPRGVPASRGPAAMRGRPPVEDRRLVEGGGGLDSSWERRLSRSPPNPDFTLDLHGHSLDAAWHRLDAGLTQAVAQGARLLLVVTGKSRPVDAADRGHSRGAIRAKLLDWIAAGPHAGRVAAVRSAHPRHGGSGALYLVLRKQRR